MIHYKHIFGAAERFWNKVHRSDKERCWPWRGCQKPSGYGRFHIGDHRVAAHRIAYVLTYGGIPDGYQIDHKCGFKDCCNPHHLEAVSPEENRRRRHLKYKQGEYAQ